MFNKCHYKTNAVLINFLVIIISIIGSSLDSKLKSSISIHPSNTRDIVSYFRLLSNNVFSLIEILDTISLRNSFKSFKLGDIVIRTSKFNKLRAKKRVRIRDGRYDRV